jgi:hypothetical protein
MEVKSKGGVGVGALVFEGCTASVLMMCVVLLICLRARPPGQSGVLEFEVDDKQTMIPIHIV